MNNGILVSIIIPVYGTENYLSQCIDSVLCQTYPSIEIILVDDQSPDSCPQICDAYAKKDSRVIVIHQDNMGVSGARNTGLTCANGDFIMFIDSDDELEPNCVEQMISDRVKYNADIVSLKKAGVDRNGKILAPDADGKCSVYRGEEPLLLSLDGDVNTNSVCAKLFRKDFIDGVFFIQGKNINEDGFFLFQCFLRKPVLVQHNISVYRYYYRENSNSRAVFSEKYLAMLYFCDQKKAIIAEHYPQYQHRADNMEVRTNLLFLDLLCRTTDKRYQSLQKSCIKTVRRLYHWFRPINKHQKLLAEIVRFGMYPIYKKSVRIKYFR